MRKDVKQRNTVVENDFVRTRLIAIRRGKMLPTPIKVRLPSSLKMCSILKHFFHSKFFFI